MPTKSRFSQRLAVAIARSGKKKGDLARSVGLSPLSLSRYLKGDRVPHETVLRALAQQLDVSVMELLGSESTALADVPVVREVDPVYPPDAVALTGLDLEDRRTVLRLLDALRSGDAEIRRHLIGQLKIIEVAMKARRQQPREESGDGA